MRAIEEIEAEAVRAGEQAQKRSRKPYVLKSVSSVDKWPPAPFPFIGTYVPKGWKEVERVMCDSSGFGSPGEPALTLGQLQEYVRGRGVGFAYAIVNAGFFQVAVAVYERT